MKKAHTTQHETKETNQTDTEFQAAHTRSLPRPEDETQVPRVPMTHVGRTHSLQDPTQEDVKQPYERHKQPSQTRELARPELTHYHQHDP